MGTVALGRPATPERPRLPPPSETPPSETPLSETPLADPSRLPIEMTAAGGIELDLERQRGTARTDVVIRRGDVTVCCDEARADYRGGRIVRLACHGRVVIRRADGTRAVADEAEYVAAQDALTLKGRVRLEAREATVSGTRLVYDIRRDRLNVVGEKSRFAFTPAPSTVRPPVRPCPAPRGVGG